MASLPNSVAANVGLAGGSPGNQAQTTAYLTQLAASLNGFTGPVSNAINFLLNQSNLPAAAAAYGAISGITLTSGSAIAWGLGASGATLTPARTGTVAAFASGNWNPNMSAAGGTNVFTQMYIGAGAVPAGGSAGLSAGITATMSFGSAGVGISQAVSGQNLWQMVYCLGFVTGLTKTQEYWVDCYSTGGGSTTGIIEFGQMLLLEV